MDIINFFLKSLPATATSPIALVAYLATLLAIYFIKSQGQKLSYINKLPANQKRDALIELFRNVPPNMTPEAFIKSKSQYYIFLSFLAVLVVITLIVILNVYSPQKSVIPWLETSINSSTSSGINEYDQLRSKLRSLPEEERPIFLESLKGRPVNNWMGWIDEIDGTTLKIDMDSTGSDSLTQLISLHDVEFTLDQTKVRPLSERQLINFSGIILVATASTTNLGNKQLITLRVFLDDASLE